ncbi:uncharacterized protein LOC110694587 [Chenopodium quinoa]|uniref:uncharacterized protein LOC110694587 n=1 Tax=Chenopodium quinoa TaxID=63459 RepID=UPI000B794EC0|nr:uncharacterized protein LOC110694587 [Chenopodium quinoa]
MCSQSTHSALPRTLSQSPGTVESRTGGAFSGLSEPIFSSPNSSLSASVQDTMARTKQTTRRSKSRRTMTVPADEVFPDGEQRDWEESGSNEEDPSTSGSSGVREVGGEGTASSNEVGSAEVGEGSRAKSSGSDQDNFAADYQQPPKVADNPNPKRTRMLPANIALLKSGFRAFKEKHPFRRGWEIIVPPAHAVMAWGDDIDHADDYFICYEAVIEADLRFPLHPGIRKILKGYDVGVWQLTPNSWVNILSYIAACEFQNINPSFSAFADMYYLSKAPGGHGAWCTLTTLPQYLMTLDKVSKWSGWKHKFYLISTPTLRHNRTLRRYNTEPALLGRKCPLPALSTKVREQIMESGFCETTTESMGDGTHIIVPKNWIPHLDFFKDECFLSACGLSTMFPRGRSLLIRNDCYFTSIAKLP